MNSLQIWFTSREIYDKSYSNDGISWSKYQEWSKLYHIEELVSLDSMLNTVVVERDFDSLDYWGFSIVENLIETGFFSSLEYVIQKTKAITRFNLLAVAKNPDIDCREYPIEDFEFLGYDLLDLEYNISALSNCGGFDETFFPNELNKFGLIDNYIKALDIQGRLCKNNPKEHHAFTNVMAIWRHTTIGR